MIYNRQAVEMKGYLSKFEVSEGLTALKRRWAVLADHCLYLYKSPQDKECIFAVVLPGSKIGVASNPAVYQQELIEIIEPNGVKSYINPENSQDFDPWYQALITSAAATSQPNSPQTRDTDDSYNRGYQESPPYDTRPVNPPQQRTDPRSQSTGYIPPGVAYNVQTEPNPQYSQRGPVNPPREYSQTLPVEHGSRQPQTSSANPPDHSYTLPASSREQWPENRPEYTTRDQPDYRQDPDIDRRPSTQSMPFLSSQQEPHPYHYQPERIAPMSRPYEHQPAPQGELAVDRVLTDFRRTSAPGVYAQPTRGGPGPVRGVMETVKEDPTMSDSDILKTKPIEEIRRKYPVTGLAKRMSICASDLLGKSHDELVILLIQLNREKANLEHWRDYLSFSVNEINRQVNINENRDMAAMLDEKLESHRNELADVELQIELSLPLITFIDNIVKMGGIYGGDDLMFATEYRKHLLQPNEYTPAKQNLGFMRHLQERDIARDLAQRLDLDASGGPGLDPLYDLPSDQSRSWQQTNDVLPPESVEFKTTREQLESELADLEKIYVGLRGQKSELAAYMEGVKKTGFRPQPTDPNSKANRSGRPVSDSMDGGEFTTEKAAMFPRRSTRKFHRSDMTSSLRRPTKKGQYYTLPPRRQWSVPPGSRSRTLPSGATQSKEPTGMGYSLSEPNSPNAVPYTGEDQARGYPEDRYQPSKDDQWGSSGRFEEIVPDRRQSELQSAPRVSYDDNTHGARRVPSISSVPGKPDISESARATQSYAGPSGYHPHPLHPKGRDYSMPLEGVDLAMRSEADLTYTGQSRSGRPLVGRDGGGKHSPRGSGYGPVQSATELRYNDDRDYAGQGGDWSTRDQYAPRRDEGKVHSLGLAAAPDSELKRSVQEQLNELIGAPASPHSPKSPGQASGAPLVKINPDRYKHPLGPSGTSASRDKALLKLGCVLEDYKGLQHGSVHLRGETSQPGPHHHDEHNEQMPYGGHMGGGVVRVQDDRYETSQVRSRTYIDDDRSPRQDFAQPVQSSRLESRPPRQSWDHSANIGEPRGQVERPYSSGYRLRNGIDATREGPSNNDDQYVFDESTIDRTLGTPGKIDIPERYVASGDEMTDSGLTEEDRRRKEDRVQSIRRMVAGHSPSPAWLARSDNGTGLQEWSESELGPDHHRGEAVRHEDIERERAHRERVLIMREDIGREAIQKSKEQAQEHRRSQELQGY